MKRSTKETSALSLRRNLQRILKTSSTKNNLPTLKGVTLNWPFFISSGF